MAISLVLMLLSDMVVWSQAHLFKLSNIPVGVSPFPPTRMQRFHLLQWTGLWKFIFFCLQLSLNTILVKFKSAGLSTVSSWSIFQCVQSQFDVVPLYDFAIFHIFINFSPYLHPTGFSSGWFFCDLKPCLLWEKTKQMNTFTRRHLKGFNRITTWLGDFPCRKILPRTNIDDCCLYVNVYSIIHKNQEVETTQMSITWWMGR